MNPRSEHQKVYGLSCFIVLSLLLIGAFPAEADMNQIKLYKEAFPETKPQCLFCHVDKLPKKDAGMHDLSAYGIKVKETDTEIKAETYTKVGAFEDFKEEGVEA